MELDESTQEGAKGVATIAGGVSGTTEDHTVKSGSSGGASSTGVSGSVKAPQVPSQSRVGSYNHPSVNSDSSFFAQKAAKHGSSMKTEEAKSGSFGGSAGLIQQR